jgi:hypothetical protein
MANRAQNNHTNKLLTHSLHVWRLTHIKEVTLPKALNKISHRQYTNGLSEAFEHLINYQKKIVQSSDEMKKKGVVRLHNVLDKLHRTKLAITIAAMKEQTERKRIDKELLHRMSIHCLSRRINNAFQKWRMKTEEYQLIDYVETRGETAQVVSKVFRKHKTMKKIIQSEMMQPHYQRNSSIKLVPMGSAEEFSRRLSDRSIITTALPGRKLYTEERKDVAGKYMKLWFRSLKGHDLLGKYIDNWKKWLVIRKRAEEKAAFIIKRLKFGEKAWAFDKLRNLKRAARKEFENASRTDIIHKYKILLIN